MLSCNLPIWHATRTIDVIEQGSLLLSPDPMKTTLPSLRLCCVNRLVGSGSRIFHSLLGVVGMHLLSGGVLFADGLSFLPPRNEIVISVSDFTPEGSLLPVPSAKAPVYYEAGNLGFRELGRPMAGENPPNNEHMLGLIIKTLAKQGYVLASDKHPPTQFLAFAWGTLRIGGPGVSFGPSKGILKFLGADKVGHLMEDADNESDLQTGLRDFRSMINSKGSAIADQIYDAAGSDLYIALIRSYDYQAAAEGKLKQLWETRISLPSSGLDLATALPVAIVTAGPIIGRDTPKPVWVDTSDGRQGHVQIGDLKVLEYMDPAQHPVMDLTKPSESGKK